MPDAEDEDEVEELALSEADVEADAVLSEADADAEAEADVDADAEEEAECVAADDGPPANGCEPGLPAPPPARTTSRTLPDAAAVATPPPASNMIPPAANNTRRRFTDRRAGADVFCAALSCSMVHTRVSPLSALSAAPRPRRAFQLATRLWVRAFGSVGGNQSEFVVMPP